MSDEEVCNDSLALFHQVANRSLAFYPGLSQASVRLLNYSENATYFVEEKASGEKYILRVSQPGYHTKPELESEIAWLHAIRDETSIEVLLPIPNYDGEYIQSVQLENVETEYFCTMFTFLPGKSPEEEQVSDLIRHFETLGEMTALLHNHSSKWIPTDEITRPIWEFDTILGKTPIWGRWQDGLGITPERAELFQQVADVIQQRLERFGKDSNRFGMIHADLRLTNFIIEGDRIKVIDFDDCGYGWYLFDLASSLSFIEHESYVPELIESWLKGYRKVRDLSQQEEQEIPTFIMMRRLMLISWIGSRDNETSRSLGSDYTVQTDRLAKEYLQRFGKEGSS